MPGVGGLLAGVSGSLHGPGVIFMSWFRRLVCSISMASGISSSFLLGGFVQGVDGPL